MSSEQRKPLILPLFAPSIASDRNWFRLDQLADVIDCPHSTPELIDDPNAPLVVRSQDMRSGTFMTELAGRVSEETYKERISRAEPQFGDLLYSREGTYFGIAAEVPPGVRVCLGQRMVLIRPRADQLDHRFLRHWLNSPQIFGHIHGFRDGTVAERLNLPTIRGVAVALPALRVQQRVGEILGALDDRITLLRETNATLEAITQALFKSWFVDFDPVRAKAEGRQPEGMDAPTVALFPDSFEESELGPVPKGWRVRSLDSIADYLNGLALQKFPPSEDSWLPVIKIAQLRKGDAVGADRAGRNIKPEYVIQNGDVLFSWSGSLEVVIWCGGEGALNQHLFKVTSAEFPKWFYYLWTRQHLPAFQQIAASKATTMGHIQRKHLTDAKVVVPPEEVIQVLGAQIESLVDRWLANAEQAQTLTQLRDTLLPRLISGQLRLPEAEALMVEVGS